MTCSHCRSRQTRKRHRTTQLGYALFRCGRCQRTDNERTGTRFHFLEFPTDIVFPVLLCRLRDKLSLRDLAELFLRRGFVFTHETVRDREERFAPLLAEPLRRKRKGPCGRKWFVEETYRTGKGTWCDLYRARDEEGHRVDSLRSEKRDRAAAQRFFQKALPAPGHPAPRVTNVDRNPAYPAVVEQLQAAGSLRHRCRLPQCRYLNHGVEQEHRATKRRVKASGGCRSFRSARRTIRGDEAMHMIRKGQACWGGRQDAARQAHLVAKLLGVNA